MFNNCRFGFLTVAFVAALILSTFGSGSLADEPISEAERFFNAMSPEQFSDPVALDDFIRRFPDSVQARYAFALRYSLLEQAPTIDGYNEFIKKYPDKLQTQVAIQEVFKLYRYQDRVTGYYDFIRNHPNTQQAVVAMMRIQELMFQYVCRLDKEEEYDAYISAFPDAPQVPEALKRAYDKALEKEKIAFEGFKNSDPKPSREEILDHVSAKISNWEKIVNRYQRANPNTDAPDSVEVQMQLFQINRQADVLLEVYGQYDHAGRISNKLGNLQIVQRLDKIQKTLETNHKELLAKLDEESERICERLQQLHLDNEQLIKDVREGFAVLHQDMVEIKTQLSKINETLDKMDRHLEDINRSIVEGFKQTNETLKQGFATLNNTIQTGFEVQAQLQRDQLAVLRQQSEQLTDLSLIAQNGYNRSGSLWESDYAAGQTNQMNRRFTATGANAGTSTIARFVGSLASSAASFIPGVGPYIAPAVGRVTERLVDDVAIPSVQNLYADITNPNDRRTLAQKCVSAVNNAGPQFMNSLTNALPVVWQQEQNNILRAAQILANNSGIPEEYSRPILEAVGTGDLNEAVNSLANHYNIPPDALRFAAQFIY